MSAAWVALLARPRTRIAGASVATACLLALSQASCMLVGYDGHQFVLAAGISDAGSASKADASPGVDVGTGVPDAAVPGPLSGGEPGADADVASLADVDASGLPVLPDPASDASVTTLLPDPTADASGSDAATSDDAATPACSGTPALGLCWHLGGFGLSCDQACDTYYGGFDPRTILYTGEPREGGSLANCQTVLVALGATAAPMAGYRPDGLGLGCHMFNTGATYWIDDRQPGPFDSGDSYFAARRACACAH